MRLDDADAASCDIKPESAWYALHMRHQHEKTIAEMLCMKSFEVFLPLCTVARRWRDRTKEISLAVVENHPFTANSNEATPIPPRQNRGGGGGRGFGGHRRGPSRRG